MVTNTLPGASINIWTRWTTPRSTDRDEAFRENTTRISVAILIIALTLGLIIQVTLFSTSNTTLPYTLLLAPSLLMSVGSAVALERKQLLTAGRLLTLCLMTISLGLAIIHGLTSNMVIPTIVLTLIVATLVLPRSSLLPLSAAALVSSLLIAAVQTYSPAPITLSNNLSFTLFAMFFLVLMSAVYLRQLRVEFDNRLAAVTKSLLETQLATEKAQQALKEAELAKLEAERANHVKSQFLANMSHELRTPLNAIIGYIEIMLAGMAGSFTDKQTELQGYVHQNAKRLLALINDILNLAKIESGKLDVTATPASPRKLISDIVNSNLSLAQQKNITLEATFADDMPEAVLCDIQKVQQIVTNLISNAVKFTAQGGVEVKVGTSDKNNWQIWVIDSGIGMPADAPSYIFDKFSQVDNSVTREHHGTGLGLAIVKSLVEGMGGEIKVDTMLGKGTTFTVTLPRVIQPGTLGAVKPVSEALVA